MANVVVTGANGFIGTQLVEHLLEAGHHVRCLVRSPDGLRPTLRSRVEVFRGDVRHEDSLAPAFRHADQVFHLAGLVKARRASDLFAVNHDGTLNVGHCCRRQPNPPTFVYVSSLAAAGPCQEDAPRRESDPPAPISRYGCSKLQGERVLRGMSRDLPLTIVRPAVVFGPGDLNSFAIFRPIARFGVHAAPTRRPWPISVIHSEDLCRLLMLAADRGRRIASADEHHDAGDGVYFATCREPITYAEFGELIGAALGRERIRVVPQPRWAGFALAGLNQTVAGLLGRTPILNVDKMREAFAGAWYCSSEKAECELGFRPAATLAERVRQAVDWYRAHGWLRGGISNDEIRMTNQIGMTK
jgi:dihydroflavonol-4-reductase